MAAKGGNARLFFENRPDCPVKAAGIILKRMANGAPEFLLQIRRYVNDKYRPRWLPLLAIKDGYYDVVEDFGGKVEDTDASIVDIMVREASEESNGRLDISSIRERLSLPSATFFYQRESKYAFAIVDATAEEMALTGQEFGDREQHEEWLIERTVRWMSVTELQQYRRNMHCRLHVSGAFGLRFKK